MFCMAVLFHFLKIQMRPYYGFIMQLVFVLISIFCFFLKINNLMKYHYQ